MQRNMDHLRQKEQGHFEFVEQKMVETYPQEIL